MPKRPDLNQIAASIVRQSTDSRPSIPVFSIGVSGEKNPAAVALGRLGGLKGGKARADKLTPERRKRIAKKAAKARWKRKKQSKS